LQKRESASKAPLGFASKLKQKKNMKTLEEIRARIAEITKEQRALYETAKTEKRDSLNEAEVTKFDALNDEFEKLVKEEKRMAVLEARELEDKVIEKRFIPGEPNKEKKFSEGEERDLNSFSFGKAIATLFQNRSLDGVEKEMHEEGVNQYREAGLKQTGNLIIPQMVMAKSSHRSSDEMKRSEKRDLTAATTTEGEELIQTSVGSLIDRLRNRLVIGQLGATQLSGLVGNIDFPVFGSNDAAVEKAENAASAESSPTFTTKTISPNRLPVHVEYSRQLLIQAQNESVESMLRNDLAFQIASKIDAAAINGAGTGAIPEGILNTSGIGAVVGGTDGAAPDWADIVDLETAVAIDNADIGSLGYLVNAATRGKLKKTFVDASSNAERVWDTRGGNMPLNGYNTAVSNLVPSNLTKGSSSGVASALIYGNFADVLLAQWGGLEFLINPYTLDTTGLIRLNAWTFYDVLIRRAESFAAMQDALTA